MSSGVATETNLKKEGVSTSVIATSKIMAQKFTLRLLQRLGRRQNVTLMCHCDEDQAQCHRHLLKRILDSKIA
jgi:hypothetical protein